MDIYLLVIFLLAIFSALTSNILYTRSINKEDLELLKEKQKKLKNLKNMSKEEVDKLFAEMNELYMKIFPKQIKLMLLSYLIFIPILIILKYVVPDVVYIPLPFKFPITGRYGLGRFGTFIVFALILNPIVKKLLSYKKKS